MESPGFEDRPQSSPDWTAPELRHRLRSFPRWGKGLFGHDLSPPLLHASGPHDLARTQPLGVNVDHQCCEQDDAAD
jgi:hypothetical protein